MKKILLLMIMCVSLLTYSAQAEETTVEGIVLSFNDFIEMATNNDTEFEAILIDEMMLQYQRDIKLPARDIVLSVKQQHEFYFSKNRNDPDTTVGLTKLFPLTGTELGVDYSVGTSLSSSTDSSELSFTIAQPIAENAFGYSTRLLDKIVGLEVDVARHQVIEAYEDYFATVITAYYTWYEDYQNLAIGQNSYKENIKLLENMEDRQTQKIALAIGVNKVKLQVLSKKEQLIELEEDYRNSTNIVNRIMRNKDVVYIPELSEPMAELDPLFGDLFKQFKKESRTFEVLAMLESKSDLQVKRDANELLPSIDIIAGYSTSGEDYEVREEDNFFYVGIDFEWPLTDQVGRAEYEVAKLTDNKQKLSTMNTYQRLYAQLFNLFLNIEKEKELIKIADERIDLAQAVLDDESENYSFGKITLNDYIQAFNALDNNRFNKISHDTQYKKFIVEWLRLTDKLVNQKSIFK